MPYDDVTPAGGVRRIEVFTGTGPRRRWSPEEKARIVAESYAGVGTVCDVARRHALAPTQLFTWRRGAKLPREARSAPTFAPVVIEAAPLPVAAPRAVPTPKKTRRSRQSGIELEIDGVVMRVSRGAEAKTVAAVIRALKAER